MKSLTAAACLATAFNVSAATVTVLATADTTLWELDPNNNIGSDILGAGSIRQTTFSGQPYRSRAVMKFDLTGKVPAGAVISSVKLTVTIANVPLGGPGSNFELHRMLKDWGEGTGTSPRGTPAFVGQATWVTPSVGGPNWSVPGAEGSDDSSSSVSSSVFIGTSNATFPSTTSLIADVQAWLTNPSSNFGWLMKSDNETTPQTARRFNSRETGNGPSLEITYSLPPPDVRIQTFRLTATGMELTWTGGLPPYRVQRADAITGPWTYVTDSSSQLSATAPLGGAIGFYRVASQVP